MTPRALLLDFDGVIADTENVHIAAWQRTLDALGWQVSDELCARAIEVDDRVFLSEIFAARQIRGGDVDGWVRRKQELTLALLDDSPRVYPGVAELVERVRNRVKLGVVSTTWRANVVSVLKSSDLYTAFSLIVAKEDVTAVKPDPEAYRRAVECLVVKPAEAVAIEDSATGLAAARRAGVRPVAVGHRLGQGVWHGKAPFVRDLRRTDEVLAAVGLA
jgi:beta-phosphoglucomutase